MNLQIRITDPYLGQLIVTPNEWAKMAVSSFKLDERVEGVQGEAFDLKEWFAIWRNMNSRIDFAEPSHIRVRAIDEFSALIPWAQLNLAAVQYAIDGEQLSKGYPIRLYVPNGSSECLNVKSIIQVEFVYDEVLGEVAKYGFNHYIKPEEMRKSKGD